MLAGKRILPPREQAYAALSWGSGPYPWIQNQLFQEKGDIDIALIGSSHILHCLDARWLQAELSKKLGRPAVVRVMGWGGAGFDAVYFITRDLLQNRRVQLLVVYNEANAPASRNAKSPAWFRAADGLAALRGLPWPEQSYFYFAALVGLPRNLLALVRPNLPAGLHTTPPNEWETHYRSVNLADNLGSTTSELSMGNGDTDPTVPFIPYAPPASASPAAACVYAPATRTNFQFSSAPLPVWQEHFARQLLTLARDHACRLVLLHIPTLDEARVPLIPERAFWQTNLSDTVCLLGVPPEKMFAGLADADLRQLYFNPSHLNKNGQAYFTSLIGPALISLYDPPARR